MSFTPENKPNKNGLPVYNGNGDQRNLSDPRYRYQDGIENTTKPQISSSSDIFYTKEGALARSLDLDCNGYHEMTYKGETVYMPCSSEAYYGVRKDQYDSALNFTYVGNNRILSWDSPFEHVNSFDGWLISAGLGNNNGVILDAEDISIDFRYSIDGESWSLWTNLGTALTGVSDSENSNNGAEIFSIPLNPKNLFYPEFRFTSVVRNDDGSIAFSSNEPIDPSIVILDFDLVLSYTIPEDSTIASRPNLKCSDEKSDRPVVFDDCAFSFDPYAINQGINLYQDLSLIVNKVFGFDVNYYSVQPQARGKDVVLKEHTLFNVVSESCIKVVVPQNQFPDNKINFDPFGLQFDEPFEIHVDKKYFESIFGKNSQPRKRDIIYFELTNRIYEINSTYLFRDFMYSPVYFKIELKKYNPKSNTYFNDPAHKEELEGISISSDDLFGAEIKSEEEKITKPKQYNVSTSRRSEDPNRSYIYDNLSIVGFDLNNNWTIVFNNYYDLESSFIDDSEFIYSPKKYRDAVRYKSLPSLSSGEELSYTSWFSIKNYIGESKFTPRPFTPIPVTLESKSNGVVLYSTYPNKHNLVAWNGLETNPNGYVSIDGDGNHSGGFEVLSVIDDYRFTVSDNRNAIATNTTGWRIQKAQARNMLSGSYLDSNDELMGINIDIVHSGFPTGDFTNFINKGSIIIRINGEILNSPMQFNPDADNWYGIVVNLSNKYKQLSTNIWEMSYDETNPQAQTSDLRKVHEDVRTLESEKIFSAPSDIEEDTGSPYYGTDNNSYSISTSPLYITNLRVFKNMIDIDKQSIVLNQNIVRDENLAHVIDNANPILNLPRFARSR